MNGHLRIRPECVEEVLTALTEIGVEPLRTYSRDDGAIAIEIGELTGEQGSKLASIFRPEWSAIIGVVGGDPFETKH